VRKLWITEREGGMGLLRRAFLSAAALVLAGAAAAEEIIVFVRHGEKPAVGLGQLDWLVTHMIPKV